MEKNRTPSTHHQFCLGRQSMTAGNCGGGALVKPDYLRQYRAFSPTDLLATVSLADNSRRRDHSTAIGYRLCSHSGSAAEARVEAAQQRQSRTSHARVRARRTVRLVAHSGQPLTAILSNAGGPPLLAQIAGLGLRMPSDIVKEDNRAGEVINRLRSLLKKRN